MTTTIRTSLAAATTLLVAAPALAGITFTPSVDLMIIGNGFVDAESPDPISGVDSALIAAPPEGSLLLMGGTVPGVGSFATRLEFDRLDDDRAVFAFDNQLTVSDLSGSGFEFAMSGSRVTITSETPLLVSLRGMLEGSGGGLAGFNVLGDPVPPVFFAVTGDPVAYDLFLAAGTYSFAWGALVGPTGGSARFEGEMSFVSVPAPGTAALLVAAGLVTGRRRRRG
jgi:hypothetical protein